ncbi:ClbS/DfsB family four-helix bundle protein [Lacticaseibacillus mingshuiensis]|uniref:ClbS/DfsB family four-helix bundle protein n=1 Tax=Lacticaseibacillus mingshuiensis TaxID=2799574 RepID=UPI00194E7AAC|nr:ClbS/DfsB family four-helix bundle protein [Lacticaseibacillus mingshuiensis]
MMRPQTRQDLLYAVRTEYDRFEALLAELPYEGKRTVLSTEGHGTNMRDVLARLAAWQKCYLDWTKANFADEQQGFFPKPFNWQTVPRFNRAVWEANQKTSFAAAKRAFETQHVMIVQQVEDMIKEQLFVPEFYPWTGKRPLADYTFQATVARYQWANRQLAKYEKATKQLQESR